MITFASTDLKQTLGDVLAAAAQGPVAISRHKKPRFVLMTIEHYERRNPGDPRRAYHVSDAPPDQVDELLASIEEQLEELKDA
jgi:prevent-host-death family protein